jgi:protein TonB
VAAIFVSEALDASGVYRKSGLGAARLAAPHSDALSPRERNLLILLDGRRTVSELSELLGAENVGRLMPSLLAKGFARRVDPQPDADWDNAITQLYVDRPDRTRPPARARPARSDGHPLAWTVLLFVSSIGFAGWFAHDYRSRADVLYRLVQVPAIEASAAPSAATGTIAGALGAGRPEPLAQATVTPISRLPAAVVPTPAAPAPGRVPPHVAPRQRQAGARADARNSSPPPAAAAAGAQPAEPASAQTVVGAPATEVAAALPAPDPPAAAPATQVALQAPAAPPAAEPAALLALRRDPPRLPEQAARGGLAEGHAQVRLWITPEGKVDQVDILQAQPPGVFEDEVRRALSLWSFDPPGRPTDQVVELTLKP